MRRVVPDAVCLGYADQSIYSPSGSAAGGLLAEYIDRDLRARATSTMPSARRQPSCSTPASRLRQPGRDDQFRLQPGRMAPIGQRPGGLQRRQRRERQLHLQPCRRGAKRKRVDSGPYARGGPQRGLHAGQPRLAFRRDRHNNDFFNSYAYQGVMGQMRQVTQQAVSGGDAVAAKTATFAYDLQGEFTTVSRYQNPDATANLVAQAAYVYDNLGNMTSLAYTNGGSTLRSYSWSYDNLGNMATAYNNLDGTASYQSDSTGQLTSAAYQPQNQSNELYSYDSNGNRLTAANSNTGGNQVTYVSGPNNELLYDGTYNYQYDANGNLTAKYVSSSGQDCRSTRRPATSRFTAGMT